MTTTPEETKKGLIFEVFRAAVWAEVLGPKEAQIKEAIAAAEAAGVTEEDFAIIDGDAKQLSAYFGEGAIGRDLVNAMKTSDVLSGASSRAFPFGGSGPSFKSKGFY